MADLAEVIYQYAGDSTRRAWVYVRELGDRLAIVTFTGGGRSPLIRRPDIQCADMKDAAVKLEEVEETFRTWGWTKITQ